MSTIKHESMINGVDIDALKQKIQAVRDNPDLGHCEFRVRNRWVSRGHNRSAIKDFYAAGQEDDTRSEPYVLDSDEPKVLLGDDVAPNPVEYLLHALASCVTTTMVYHAAARGIEIESVESTLEGEIDLRGFFGLSNQVPRGYQHIRVTMKVKSDAPAEQLQELAKFSPVFNTIINPVPVDLSVEKA